MTESMPRSSNGAAVRGVILVLVAVAVGVLLLRSSDSTSAEVSAGDGGVQAPGVTNPPATTTSVAATEPEAAEDTTASTTPALTPSTEAPATDDTSAGTESTETVPQVTGFVPRPAAEVKIQVANSTSVKGAAGAATDQFKTLNYITATPTNLRGTALDRTRVHYQPGSLLEAQAVAEVLGLDPKNDVFQMFQDTSAIDQWDEPDVLVALGNDLAEGG